MMSVVVMDWESYWRCSGIFMISIVVMMSVVVMDWERYWRFSGFGEGGVLEL